MAKLPGRHALTLQLPYPLYERITAFATEWNVGVAPAIYVLIKQALDAQDGLGTPMIHTPDRSPLT